MSTPKCPIDATLSLISGKWKLSIIKELLGGEARFNELCRNIPNISAKVLAQQLRELEKDGLVERHVFPVVPPHVEYRLSDLGKSLLSVFKEIRRWGLFNLINVEKIPLKCDLCIQCSNED